MMKSTVSHGGKGDSPVVKEYPAVSRAEENWRSKDEKELRRESVISITEGELSGGERDEPAKEGTLETDFGVEETCQIEEEGSEKVREVSGMESGGGKQLAEEGNEAVTDRRKEESPEMDSGEEEKGDVIVVDGGGVTVASWKEKRRGGGKAMREPRAAGNVIREVVNEALGVGDTMTGGVGGEVEPPDPSSEQAIVVMVAGNGEPEGLEPRILGIGDNLRNKLSPFVGSRVLGDLAGK